MNKENIRSTLYSIVKDLWAPLVVVSSFAFWFGGIMHTRMETPQQKQERIDAAVSPIIKRLDTIEHQMTVHHQTTGHPITLERVDNIISRMEKLDVDLRDLKKEIRENFVRKDDLRLMFESDSYFYTPLRNTGNAD
tara:strand:- start:194 stop:601 length:408 start_codon:yes stop_codon:yes gene_type:complete